MLCANCGAHGHMYRICSQPISSFGIICYRVRRGEPEYLMVQRKDSLPFVEFIRGKYNVQNRGYIIRLLNGMTHAERSQLSTLSFDALWHGFWQSDHSSGFVKEYEQSKARFMMLKTGYYLRSHAETQVPQASTTAAANPGQVVFFSLETALASTAETATHTETEFGFPKGRRNINESDISCACREFSEETGLDIEDVKLLTNIQPYEEIFTGTNHTRYRHVYYIARLLDSSAAWLDRANIKRAVVDPVQSREVRAVAWFDAGNVLSHLRVENTERRAMFLHVHQSILAAGEGLFFANVPSSIAPLDQNEILQDIL